MDEIQDFCVNQLCVDWPQPSTPNYLQHEVGLLKTLRKRVERLENTYRIALQNPEFVLFCEMIVDLTTLDPIGYTVKCTHIRIIFKCFRISFIHLRQYSNSLRLQSNAFRL